MPAFKISWFSIINFKLILSQHDKYTIAEASERQEKENYENDDKTHNLFFETLLGGWAVRCPILAMESATN
jgi:hypothetical protein